MPEVVACRHGPKLLRLLTRCLPGLKSAIAKINKYLISLAHPTRFERVTLPSEGNAAAARPRSGICRWRKIEEAKPGGADVSLKLLKTLALPRGIEPLFQP